MILSVFSEKNLFKLGLFFKILFVIFFIPDIQDSLFTNFIYEFINNPSLSPWSEFMLRGGDLQSFPYGPVMFLIFLPISFLGNLFGGLFNESFYFTGLGLRVTLLIIDFLCLKVLKKIVDNHNRDLVLYYWLSPLLIFVTYWHGQLDIFPSFLMLIAFYFLRVGSYKVSGSLFAFSVATKLSMVLALPFPLIYLWKNTRLRANFNLFSKFLFSNIFLLVIIPAISVGYRKMVLGTPQAKNLLWFALPIDQELNIFLLPVAFSVLIYTMWRINRSNFSLLLSITGLSFLISILMMPPNPGWYLWALPFLIIYQVNADLSGKIFVTLFSILVIYLLIPITSNSDILFFEQTIFPNFENQFPLLDSSITFTIVFILGLILSIRLFRDSISKNDYFRLSNKSISIGISGSPKSGKKSLANNLENIFGKSSLIKIDSNEFKRWDKKSLIWKTLSIENPRAYNLLSLTNEIQYNLSDSLFSSKKQYDFKNSKFQKKKNKIDIIIATGYHLFLAKSLKDKFDLKIFLNPSSSINEKWAAESKSDLNIKDSKISAIDADFDIAKIYSQQKNDADIVFSLSPINESFFLKEKDNNKMKLEIYFSDGIYAESLAKALISICGLKVDTQLEDNSLSTIMSIEGEIWPGDIALTANYLVPHLDELLDSEPKWKSDLYGIMQIVVLMQIDHKLRLLLSK